MIEPSFFWVGFNVSDKFESVQEKTVVVVLKQANQTKPFFSTIPNHLTMVFEVRIWDYRTT